MTDQQNGVEISINPGDKDAESKVDKGGKSQKSIITKRKISQQRKILRKLKEQEDILKRVIKDRDNYQDKYLRSLAEIDNYRKRIKKEKEEYQRYVLGDFLLDLLDVFDNLERALKTSTTASQPKSEETLENSIDEKSIMSGVEMIFKQLQGLLKKNGVKEIEALNKTFDPNLHQALSKVEQDDISESLVLEVYQKGFTYNGKLLRPALTKVAIPKTEDGSEQETREKLVEE